MGRAKNAIKSAALRAGVWVGNQTPSDEILKLLHELRPLSTSIGLRRFGPKNDGGYLMPDDLEGITACISPGVSFESRFDLEIAERGIDVYMVDGSVGGPSISHPRFHFTKKYLGPRTCGDHVTIDDFCRDMPNFPVSDLLLEMDIEGDEYLVLPQLSDELLRKFRIIAIEMHYLDQMFLSFPFRIIKSCFQTLMRYHHVVHIHPNNCCGSAQRAGVVIPRAMEFTLYRKDRGLFSKIEGLLPELHLLDDKNVINNPPLVLPKCWR
jgi:hypothetical protein